MAARSFVSSDQAREVHTLSLRHDFERLGHGSALRFALGVLEALKEVQHLGDGYWYPAPTRCVPIGKVALLLSISPTDELQRHFPSVTTAGFGRVVERDRVHSLPEEPLEKWLGKGAARSPEHALSDLLMSWKAGLVQSVESPGTEYLGAPESVRGSYQVRWTHILESAIRVDGVCLARRRVGVEAFRFFVCGGNRNRLLESPIAVDGAEAGYLLLHASGNPPPIFVYRGQVDDVYVPAAPPPRPLRRLLHAIGKRANYQGKAYAVNPVFRDMVAMLISSSGAKIREQE